MTVLFIDMDSFYASCELLRHPELRDKAFAIGTAVEGERMRGVVEACNYKAKKSGIRSAMPMVTALKIKKDLVYVPSDHDYYDEISAKVMALIRSYGFKTEVLSVDEAAVGLRNASYEDAGTIAKKMKDDVAKKIGLPCTIGISEGKIFAKMVCDSAKPDGLKMVKGDSIKAFISQMGVSNIPGVGSKTKDLLHSLGIETVGELSKADPTMLIGRVGSFGKELYLIANGKDYSEVEEDLRVLSLGRERTLGPKSNSNEGIDRMLDLLSEEVIKELNRQGLVFKTITVKAKYQDFSEKIKSKSLSNYSDSLELLQRLAKTLMVDLVSGKQIRKVGVRVSSFADAKGQKKLF